MSQTEVTRLSVSRATRLNMFSRAFNLYKVTPSDGGVEKLTTADGILSLRRSCWLSADVFRSTVRKWVWALQLHYKLDQLYPCPIGEGRKHAQGRKKLLNFWVKKIDVFRSTTLFTWMSAAWNMIKTIWGSLLYNFIWIACHTNAKCYSDLSTCHHW